MKRPLVLAAALLFLVSTTSRAYTPCKQLPGDTTTCADSNQRHAGIRAFGVLSPDFQRMAIYIDGVYRTDFDRNDVHYTAGQMAALSMDGNFYPIIMMPIYLPAGGLPWISDAFYGGTYQAAADCNAATVAALEAYAVYMGTMYAAAAATVTGGVAAASPLYVVAAAALRAWYIAVEEQQNVCLGELP